jgi:hypothetical protein
MRAKTMTALALLALAAGAIPAGADLTPVGLWQSVDQDTKQPNGWFLITDHGGVYDGIIAKMFLQPGQDPNVVCSRCKDDRYNKPWLGLEIIRGMKPAGASSYEGGTILDPRDGKVYDAEMKLSPDGQTLIVRGYLGISLLGRNQYWTRLPDADLQMLDPSIRALATGNAAAPVPLPPARR